MSSKRKQNENIFQEGFKILTEEKNYSPKLILDKINACDIKLSFASLSNLNTGKRRVGDDALTNAVLGIEKILDKEFGFKYDENEKKFTFAKDENWEPKKIVVSFENEEWNKNDIVFNKGRIGFNEKIKLYENAKREIVEIGVRLNTFSNYFSEEGDENFFDPILKLLNRGVDFHCYTLNEKGRYAAPYFHDREKELKGEEDAFKSIPTIRKKLIEIFKELNTKSEKGKMHLYIYNTNPYFHAKVINGNFHPRDKSSKERFTEEGIIYITQYLFGIPRSKSPSFTLTKKINKDVYKTYWTSIDKILNHSKKIDLNKTEEF